MQKSSVSLCLILVGLYSVSMIRHFSLNNISESVFMWRTVFVEKFLF